jgi:hypothetical protein
MAATSDPGLDDTSAVDRQLTDTERRNLERMERFRELYNGDDMERFVREAYAPTFRVVNLDGSGWTWSSRHRRHLLEDGDLFVRAEVFIQQRAPGRRMRFNRLIPAGDVVVAEASLVDENRPDWELAWCGVYTFDADGLIVSDHTYLNHRDWPGISELVPD